MANPDQEEIAEALYRAVCITVHGMVPDKWVDLDLEIQGDVRDAWISVAKTLLGAMGK